VLLCDTKCCQSVKPVMSIVVGDIERRRRRHRRRTRDHDIAVLAGIRRAWNHVLRRLHFRQIVTVITASHLQSVRKRQSCINGTIRAICQGVWDPVTKRLPPRMIYEKRLNACGVARQELGMGHPGRV